MKPYLSILRSVLLYRRGYGARWLDVVLWSGLVVLPVFGALTSGRRDAGILAMLVLGMIAHLWALMFAAGIQLQNTPANARLVPQLHARLLRVCAFVWGAATLVISGAMYALVGNALSLVLSIGLLLIGILLMVRRPLVALLPAGGALLMMTRFWTPACAALAHPGVAVPAALALLAIGALALRALLPNGGDQHQAALTRMASWTTIERYARAQQNCFGSGRWRWVNRGYFSDLRRACARRGDGGTMLPFLFGPGNHWSRNVVGCLAIPSLIWLLVQAIRACGVVVDAAYLNAIMWPLVASATLTMAIFLQTDDDSLRRSTGEQALLRLTPVMPQGRALNRLLAQLMLGRFLQCWASSTLALLASMLVLGASNDDLQIGLAITALALPLAGLSLRNYAATSRGAATTTLVLSVLGMGALMLVFALARARPAPLPWWSLTLLCCIGACVIVRLRWRAMLRAPVAFPAGRMVN